MTPDTVTAKSFWVWTKKAQEQNPQFNRAGDPIWPHYKHEAPARWLEDGLICDSTEVVKEGQTDLFDYIGG
ncbi:hypothetical protein [Paenibacillus lautus]|uniref:Uncharacterized protein n=1 Tax=Paenibacillus lautus TaxID=1401 RepID=A0A385TW93_PAELA|nr:hypothetical protein [Paenibacillus lautus]AYB47144.1 hypothetical protein D5F53_29295 [Paenibacillus lautus]